MQSREEPTAAASVGYIAHNERSRATFLRQGQEILETYGPNATTQEIQSVTGVSTTTLYRYFKSREAFIIESFRSIWVPWIQNSLELASRFDDDLIAMVFPIRMLLGINKTNPRLAAIIVHKDFRSEEMYLEIRQDWVNHFKSLVETGVLPSGREEARMLIFVGAAMFLVKNTLQGLTLEEANRGLELALSVLGLSDSQIEKVMQVPLSPSLSQ